jgi:phosphomannomutase
MQPHDLKDHQSAIYERAQAWLQDPFDLQTKQMVQDWIDHDPGELKEGFWKDLEFGTGGMRGIMGVGSSRMNKYTIQKATQGLCNWLKERANQKNTKKISAVIAYDSRHHSQEFAKEAACVFAANDVEVFFFKHLRPTPMLSFAVRHLEASCGIMITASHNPSIYNGFKVYSDEGCQVYAPDDQEIVRHVEQCDYTMIQKSEFDHPLIHHLDEAIDQDYLQAIARFQQIPALSSSFANQLKIVYTGIHGTGITLAPQALYQWGFSQVHIVDEQSQPDGNFPTVTAPNPEDQSAMELGIQQLLAHGADILLANDPDADRLGVGIHFEGKCRLLTGQEISILLADHMMRFCSLNGDEAVIKSVVTSDLLHRLCNSYKVRCFDVLPGFKFIGRLIQKWSFDNSPYQFIFGAEESHGYLVGNYARDKDGIIAACLMAEAALQAKSEGLTLIDRLQHIYQQHGYYSHSLINLVEEDTMQGQERIAQSMSKFRFQPPLELAGFTLSSIQDLLKEAEEPLTPANLIIWKFGDMISMIIRPSGTEPKIKIYINILSSTPSFDSVSCAQQLETAIRQFLKEPSDEE